MKLAKQRGKLRLAGQQRAGRLVDNRPIWRAALRRAGINARDVKDWNVKD